MTYFLSVTADERSKIAFIDALKIEYIFINDRNVASVKKKDKKRFVIVGIINGIQFDLWEHSTYEKAEKDLIYTVNLIIKKNECEEME